MRDRWLFSWALGSVSFGGASLLVPLYIVQLGASPVQLGVLAATAAIIGAPGAILFGRLANRVERRRPLVLLTLTTVTLTLAVMPWFETITAVIVANAILWLAVASIAPVLTMVVVEESPESAWSERIGRLNTYQGYGWAGGLVVGAVWPLVGAQFVGGAAGTRALFWVLAAGAGASTVTAARLLPRPGPQPAETTGHRARRIARLLAETNRGIKEATFAFSPNRLYWTTRGLRPRRLVERFDSALGVYLLAAVCFFTGFAAFWAPLPLVLTTAGFDAESIFAVYLASSLGAAVLYGGAGQVAAQYDPRLLQAGALAVRGLLFPSIALLAGVGAAALEVGTVAVGLAAIGGTWAVIAVVGTAVVTRLAPRAIRGEVLGVYTALSAIGGGLGSMLGGWMATGGFVVAFGVAGGLVLVGAGLVLSVRAISDGPLVVT